MRAKKTSSSIKTVIIVPKWDKRSNHWEIDVILEKTGNKKMVEFY